MDGNWKEEEARKVGRDTDGEQVDEWIRRCWAMQYHPVCCIMYSSEIQHYRQPMENKKDEENRVENELQSFSVFDWLSYAMGYCDTLGNRNLMTSL